MSDHVKQKIKSGVTSGWKSFTGFVSKLPEFINKDNIERQKATLNKLSILNGETILPVYELQQTIREILSGESNKEFVDKDEMENELNEIAAKLCYSICALDESFEDAKYQIKSTYEIDVQYGVLTTFQTVCGKSKKFFKKCKSEFDATAFKFNISKEAVLARTIKAKAIALRVQPEVKNNLKIFKLPLRQTHIVPGDKLRRYELGSPQLDRMHCNILLVGMTGSGKSLQINNMINYIFGVSHRDNFRFKLILESEEIAERDAVGRDDSLALSMTSWVTSYTFHWQEGFRIPYSLTVIDTPGFGDTRGIEYDEEIIGQLRKFINNNVLCPNQELSSIGFLIQASQSRITVEQKYIFDQVLNLFGNDMKENIFIIFTFADAQPPPALSTVAANGIPYAEYFKFNNSALYAPNDTELSEHSWKFGIFSIEKYFDILFTKQPKSLSLTKQVLDEREKLRIILGALQDEISRGMESLRSIDSQSRTIVNLDGTIEANKGFKVEKTIHKQTLRVVSYSITNCSACHFTCHEPCFILGDKKQGCASMENGCCVICPSKCPHAMHTNGTNVFEYNPVVVMETVEDVMKKYDVAVGEKDDKKKLLTKMLEEYENIKAKFLIIFEKQILTQIVWKKFHFERHI